MPAGRVALAFPRASWATQPSPALAAAAVPQRGAPTRRARLALERPAEVVSRRVLRSTEQTPKHATTFSRRTSPPKPPHHTAPRAAGIRPPAIATLHQHGFGRSRTRKSRSR